MLIWIIEWSFANLRILIKVLFIQNINLIRSVPKFILDKNISLLYWRGGRFRTKGESLSKYWNISTWTGPPSMLLFQIRHSDQENKQTSTSKPASQEIIRAEPAFSLLHPSTASETCSPPPPSRLLPPPSARRENLCPANTIPGMLHAPCILLYWQLLPVSQHKASYVRRIKKFYWGNLSIYIIFQTFYFSPVFSVFWNVILPSERTGAQITDTAGAYQEPSTTSQSTSGSERSQAGGT